MPITAITPQLRTTDLEASIRFYTEALGLGLAFRYSDFYAGIGAGGQTFHLKRTDQPDPSIAFVQAGDHLHLYLQTDDLDAMAARVTANRIPFIKPPHDTPWGTREFSIQDNQGHIIYIGA
jgi:catechol 2,3-dioxygenase-like lactoylglutathione lyase family enzyme